MPTTRRQAAIEEGKIQEEKPHPATRKRAGSKSRAAQKRKRADSTTKSPPKSKTKAAAANSKEEDGEKEKSRSKRAKVAQDDIEHKASTGKRPTVGNRRASSVPHKTGEEEDEGRNNVYKTGTIERGHIYFFYRPKVEVEDVHSIDEVKNLHMLLIPRPPEFAAEGSSGSSKPDPTRTEEAEMKILSDGADAVPAPVTRNTSKQYHRLITIGKKKLPEAHAKGRNDTFWGSVTSIGDDLHDLVEGMGSKTYETKTRGTRHEGAARLVARGGYALVNTEARIPSQRETHLGYNVSHPAPSELSDVQTTFGIYSASSFVVQVKNPKAPNNNPAMGHTKEPDYPDWIMKDVFGAGPGGRGRESYGLRFASVETPEMLDYEGAQLLLIASRDGQQGLEASLGEGRGEALASAEDKEGHRAIMDVFREIGLDSNIFTKDTLEGHWA